MNDMEQAFELSLGIETMARHLREDIGAHNPGICCERKIPVESLRMDTNIIKNKLSLLCSLM